METIENIWRFYQNVVNLIQQDYSIANNFVEQAATSMMIGKEFGGTDLNSEESYEISFILNLILNHNSVLINLSKLSVAINKDPYFESLITKNPLLVREILVICRLVNELEDVENFTIAKDLLRIKGSKLQESYNSFSKMRNIIRKGWVVRNVEQTYQENDAIHIMQMFALAMAYFRFDKSIDLDRKKVYETILIHEIGEVLADDIREGTPEHDTKHDIEKLAVEKTFSCLNKGAYFIKLWNEFENRATPEAQFTYDLDKIDPILKAKILDKVLKRNDLFNDFYCYEEKRGLLGKSRVRELYQYVKEAEVEF